MPRTFGGKNEGSQNTIQETATGGQRRKRGLPGLGFGVKTPPTSSEFLYERKMTLPASEKVISVAGMNVDPRLTWVDQNINPRSQQLLSMEDPSLSDFHAKILNGKQRDPALVRMKEGPNGEPYQIIWGSRRRFVCLHETQMREKAAAPGENPSPYNLLIEVGDIPDLDAIRLARAENEDREQLSIYEEAIDILRLQKGIYNNMTVEDIGVIKGLTKSTVAKYLKVAKIDETVVGLLTSPSKLNTRTGPTLYSFLQKMTAEQREKLKDLISEGRKFQDVSKLISAISGPRKAPRIAKNSPLNFGKKGGVTASISAHRTKICAYTVKVEGFGDAELEKLKAFMKQLCG